MQSAQKLQAWVTASARSTFGSAAQLLDQHLPLARQHMAEALAKVEAMYMTHVAAWVSHLPSHLLMYKRHIAAWVSAMGGVGWGHVQDTYCGLGECDGWGRWGASCTRRT